VFSPTDLATSTCITQRVLQSFTLKCSFHLVGASNRLISTAAGTSPGAARAELLRMRRNSVQRAVCCTSFGVLGVLCCFMTDLRALGGTARQGLPMSSCETVNRTVLPAPQRRAGRRFSVRFY
jgi:hypothetical protein